MRKTLFLASLLLLSLSSIAQNLPRLVSKIDSFNSGSILGTRYDSTRFFYTGTRKDFDSTLQTEPNAATRDTPIIRVVQHFNSVDSISETVNSHKQGSVLYEWGKTVNAFDAQNRKTGVVTFLHDNGIWDTSEIESYAYDNSNNVIEYTYDIPGVEKFKYWYQYDANNNWLGFYQAQFDTTNLVWDTIEHFICTYNVDNNRLSGTIQVPQSGSWQTVYADSNVYNGPNIIFSYNYSVLNGIYGMDRRDSNVYNSNNDQIYQLSYYYRMLGPVCQKTYNSYDNAHHLLLSLTGQVAQPLDSMAGVIRYQGSYNSYGQISTAIKEISADSGKTWSPITGQVYLRRYHYEDEPISVPGLVKNTIAVELYPNPATSVITINAGFNTPQPSQIAILDIKGNVMMQWNEAATAQLHKMVPLQFLSAGNYVLVVKSSSETQSRIFTVK